jgi:hypothetical protein
VRLLAAIDQTRGIHSGHLVEVFSLVSPQGNFRGAVTGDADFVSNAGTTNAEGGGVEAHAVFRAGTVWISTNAPQLTRLLPPGKTWVEASAAEFGRLGVFHPLGNTFAILDAMRGVRTIRQSGPDTATFTFSLAQAMAQTPASRRAALKAAINANGDIQSETGTVALTSSGTVRSESLRIVGAGSNAGIRLETSLAVSNIGETVSPTAPPAAHVISLSAMPALQSALRSSASSS